MKTFICATVLLMVGCGVMPQAHEPVGGTRDLVSPQYRLYAQEVADDAYCILLEDKSDKSTVLLTDRGALNEQQLRVSIGNKDNWEVALFLFMILTFQDAPAHVEAKVRTDRFAALQVRDAHIALTTKQSNKIITRIRNAKPETSASSCNKFDTAFDSALNK